MPPTTVDARIVAPLICAACSHTAKPASAGAFGTVTGQLTVAPGKFAEVCGKLNPPADVQWQFSANVPLTFNIHYHEGKAVKFPAKQDGVAEGSGKLGVKIQQDYCWMWTNKSIKESTLRVTL